MNHELGAETVFTPDPLVSAVSGFPENSVLEQKTEVPWGLRNVPEFQTYLGASQAGDSLATK